MADVGHHLKCHPRTGVTSSRRVEKDSAAPLNDQDTLGLLGDTI